MFQARHTSGERGRCGEPQRHGLVSFAISPIHTRGGCQRNAYRYSFHVTNFGDAPLFYNLTTVAQTEGVTQADGRTFMSGAPKALDAVTTETTDALVPRHDLNGSGQCDSHDAYLIYQAAVAGKALEANRSDVSFRYNTNGDETVDGADVQAYLNALVGLDSNANLDAKVVEVKAGTTQTIDVAVTLADTDKAYFQDNYPNGGLWRASPSSPP